MKNLKRIVAVAFLFLLLTLSNTDNIISQYTHNSSFVASLTQVQAAEDEIKLASFEEWNPAQAKQLLIDGNERFVLEQNEYPKMITPSRRHELSTLGQHPFAIIVSCSDSRVPPEIVFDQSLGKIFIIRSAGNIVDKVGIGSIEYAVEHLKAPLIVVLGHEKCGAVKATVDGGEAPGSIGAIIEMIEPALDKAKRLTKSKEELYDKCENENIKLVIENIKKSEIVREYIKENELSIVGAKYHITTGKVDFN